MSKIFITGMTASQTSEKLHQRTKTFAGMLKDTLSSFGHEVVFGNPSVSMTLNEVNQYDAVLVGVAPIGSMAANKVYGALSIIENAESLGKLTLYVDSPSTSLIAPNLRSVISSPESLTKKFFSSRKEYNLVSSSKHISSALLSTVERLEKEDWCTTIYPKLPWKKEELVKLAPNAKKNLFGVSLDQFYLSHAPLSQGSRDEKWALEHHNRWASKVVKTLSLPVSLMKSTKTTNDLVAERYISSSIGVILPPDDRDGTWWNYRYIQALNSGTPIFTEWQESQTIGSAWSVLPSNVDTMSPKNRELLATAQWESYNNNLESKEQSKKTLESLLRII